VTRKIVAAAARIAAGSKEILRLGNIDIARDWGWAPEYVDAMWRMLQQSTPSDFVIATGETRKLSDFVQEAFVCVGLDWNDHVEIDRDLFRPTDLMVGRADPGRADRVLGWKAKKLMPDVVRLMIEVEQGRISFRDL
jgi:GDPmannose 4,6-dehydratase